MATKLIEFQNSKGDTLRGILAKPAKSKDTGVIFLHGLERTAITEAKFKKLSDALLEQNILSFRFDYTGCGLSDGDFSSITVASQLDDLQKAINSFKKESKLKKFHLIGHSLSGCVIAKYIAQNPKFKEKIILLAPALNQKDLLRYWFTKTYFKKNNPNLTIEWGNYSNYLDEESFNRDCHRSSRILSINYISQDYYIENIKTDYSSLLSPTTENILFVQGDLDDKVPLESQTIEFPNKIIVQNGDHNLERPDMRDQWLPKVVEFLSS